MSRLFPKLMLEEYQEKSFYHALRTKGFVILAGLSGTGKTKIFEEFGVKRREINQGIKDKLKNIADLINKDMQLTDPVNGSFWDKTESGFEGAVVKRLTHASSEPSKIIKTEFKDYAITLDIPHSDNSLRWLHRLRFFPENDHGVSINDSQALEEFKILKKQLLLLKKFAEAGNFACIKELDCFSEKAQRLIALVCNPDAWPQILSQEEIEKLKDDNYFEENQQHDESVKKLQISIRPDFKDSKSLLGYHNPLTGKYQSTELLDFILKAQKDYIDNQINANPYLVLFDEMNLARVEYYFADFLSVLESKRVDDKTTQAEKDEMNKHIADSNDNKLKGFFSIPILLHSSNNNSTEINNRGEQTSAPKIPQNLYLPPNLYFVGSVNVDETTHMFSPKVLDRAFTIEFDADIEKYINNIEKYINNSESTNQSVTIYVQDFTRCGNFAAIEKETIRDFLRLNNNGNQKYATALKDISEILKPYGLHFGYRVFDEIIMFMHNVLNSSDGVKFEKPEEAFDLAVKMKVLPKFHGTKQRLETPIMKLLTEFCGVKCGSDDLKIDGNKLKLGNDEFKLEGVRMLTASHSTNAQATVNNNAKPTSNNNTETNNSQSNSNAVDNSIVLKIGDKELEATYPHNCHKLFEMLYKLQTNGFALYMRRDNEKLLRYPSC